MKRYCLKRKALVLTSIISVLVAVVYIQNEHDALAYPLVYEHGSINQQIVELAQLKQQDDEVLPISSDLVGWNVYLQQNFLRPAGSDHFDIGQITPDNEHAEMLPLFTKLGMVGPIMPSRKKYDLLFVYGGSPENTYQRFKFLSENIENKNIDVSNNKEILYINGLRKLHLVEVKEAKDLGVDCEYQHQCVSLIWDAHFKHLPLTLKVITIDPPAGRRANTDDSLKALYASLPNEKFYVLGYSNQPYVPYQADTAIAVAIREHKDNLRVEVVGNSNSNYVSTLAYTDSIARRVYTFVSLTPEQREDFVTYH